MKKTTVVVVLGTLLSIGALVGIKALQFKTLSEQQYEQPPAKVTHGEVMDTQWESRLDTVGSLAAVDGVEVTAEQPGKIVAIAFKPGTHVAQGDLLVQQDVSIEQAQLRAAEAAADLAKNNLRRVRRLIAQNSASVSDLESAEAEAKQADAQVDEVKARITKKSVRAPFAGRLGVKQVSLGQDLAVGEPIVTLQNLNPIQVDFFVPQRQLPLMAVGLAVRVSLPQQDLSITGEITAINPEVDAQTRNVRVQARIDNPDEQLLPGMYVNVSVELSKPLKVLAVPSTALVYAPFGNSLFVIEENETGGKVVRQQIVKTGITRGDFVQITEGLTGEETIVTTGAFKLFNGQPVEPDNSMAPQFKLTPNPVDS